MWLTAPNRIGIAAWQAGDSIWRIDARGGHAGIRLQVASESIALVASENRELPRLDEQFVRGDELHLSYPQADEAGEFGMRLVVRPVLFAGFQTDPCHAGFELLVSIQTTLLDAHPSIDLLLPASRGARVEDFQAAGCRVHFADNVDSAAAVVLGPRDAGRLNDRIDEPDAQCLRLFGEFLEKGVIRRARPWVIMNRSGNTIETQWVAAAMDALVASPLPLT